MITQSPIGAMFAILSLEMTKRLVNAGTIFKTLTVTNASNTSPIILTFSAPHGLVRPTHAIVTGILGNTNANGAWELITQSDPTQVSIQTYGVDGTTITSSGNATYTSGGTAQIAFPDGRILVGRRNIAMSTAPATPRIIVVPYGSSQWSIEPIGGVVPNFTAPMTQATLSEEMRTVQLARQLATEPHQFEVHFTGSAVPSDPDFGDFDVTQALYHLFYAVVFDLISPGRGRFMRGHWKSQDEGAASLDIRGQRWVCVLEIEQAVLDTPLTFIPTSTEVEIIVSPSGASSGDWTIIGFPVAT